MGSCGFTWAGRQIQGTLANKLDERQDLLIMVKSVMEILDIWRGDGGVVGTASLPVGRLGVGLATPLADMLRTLVSRNGAGSCGPLDLSARMGSRKRRAEKKGGG